MELSIKDLPVADRPRERLLALGPSALTEAELIALVFSCDLAAAQEVLRVVGGAAAIRRSALAELCRIPGVGRARACQLAAALELGVRAVAPTEEARAEPLRTPHQARDHLRDLAHIDSEELHVLALDGRHRLVTRFLAARGAANVVHVSPRDLYRRLIREGAVACVIAHNHPTGDPVPSEEDLELTTRLRAAGELVGVALLDHLVIATGGFYSCTAGRVFRC